MLEKMKRRSSIRSTELSDDDLFCLAQNGDVEAFNMLFKRYERKVYMYCMRVLLDEDIARDAFQDAFMRLYEHRHSYDGRNFMVWFFTIIRNVCLNMRRNKKFTVPFETSHANETPAKINDVALHEQVASALNQLPIDYREAIVLYEYDGYSYQEIADITGASIATVKIRIFRARKMLRTLLYPVVYDNGLRSAS
jgi:RNA polymerase sigma-70 factor (ECF subfamily)